jgi:signal transduction histidine kinase
LVEKAADADPFREVLAFTAERIIMDAEVKTLTGAAKGARRACACASSPTRPDRGAVLESAARQAAARVEVRFARDGAVVTIRARDDGPGVSPEDLAAPCARGLRLDQREGSGVGLSIAAELLEAASGGLTLEDARPGLAVTLTVPAARRAKARAQRRSSGVSKITKPVRTPDDPPPRRAYQK